MLSDATATWLPLMYRELLNNKVRLHNQIQQEKSPYSWHLNSPTVQENIMRKINFDKYFDAIFLRKEIYCFENR